MISQASAFFFLFHNDMARLATWRMGGWADGGMRDARYAGMRHGGSAAWRRWPHGRQVAAQHAGGGQDPYALYSSLSPPVATAANAALRQHARQLAR